MKSLRIAYSLLLLFLINGCGKDEPESEPFVKEVYTYKSVIIGSQEWMAEDLKNNCFCNGDPIPEVKETSQWAALKKPGWVYVKNDKANYGTIGKLYNWYAVVDERNICPCGWHVPSYYDEWQQLIDYLGGMEKAGVALKATGTVQAGDGLWYEPNVATNTSGFSGVPNGARGDNGASIFEPYSAAWWTTDEQSYLGPDALDIAILHWKEEVFVGATKKKSGVAVRCIKDRP